MDKHLVAAVGSVHCAFFFVQPQSGSLGKLLVTVQ